MVATIAYLAQITLHEKVKKYKWQALVIFLLFKVILPLLLFVN